MIEILEKAYMYHNAYLSFLNLKNLTNLSDSEIIVLSHYSIEQIPKDEFSFFLSTNKKIYIDGTYEVADPITLKYLSQFQNLNNVYYFYNSPEFEYLSDLINISRKNGLNFISRQYFIDFDYTYIPIFKDSYPNKKFLLYTGKPRPHRTLLIALLSYYDLLDYGYVSFFGENYIQKGFHHEIINDVYSLIATKESKDKIKKGLEKINLPLTLDVDIFDGKIAHARNFHADYYNSVDYVVVSETMFHTDAFFVTEKTTKCVILNKKFIVLGSQHFIKKLKEYYLKNFSKDISHLTDWCDISYDSESDIIIRVEKIIDVIRNNI